VDVIKSFYSYINTSISEYEPIPEGKNQYPVEYIENNHVIKLKEYSDKVIVGICDPENIMLMEALRTYHRKKVIFFKIDKSELTSYLAKIFSNTGYAQNKERNIDIDEKVLLDRLANDAPVINLMNSILIDAIRKEASDIHIEAFSDYAVVRYRLDGELHTIKKFDKVKMRAVTTRVKIMANLNIMERRLPQDGRLTVHIDGDTVDVRVSVVPVIDGESIVLRLFNKKKSLLSIESLGLSSEGKELLYKLINLRTGLVLATGPTGSGKTTTLNEMLRTIKSESLKIISIEDPVEYKIDGVNQIQTNEKIGLTFNTILKRVLRQDPNVIMIGEIRDLSTAELVVRAALTGHLVFSTLHTKDSVSVISRLRNMGIEPYLIAAVLKGSIAQRLVRLICNECKEEYKITEKEKKLLDFYNLQSRYLYRGKGCKSCSNTGYKGRTGVFELFMVEENMEEMIVKEKRESEIRSYLISRGMIPLIINGLKKAIAGLTTLSEIERVILE